MKNSITMLNPLKYYFSLLLIILSLNTFGQIHNPNQPPNTYQNADNPYYWRNKADKPGYWQQDVAYNIQAYIDEEKNKIQGKTELQYWNNSPDTLHFVFFHLYQNAYVKDSYHDQLHKANKIHLNHGPYESEGLGIVVHKLKSNDNELVGEQDNTLIKVYLDEPLAPNEMKTFEIEFTTYWDNAGGIGRRMYKTPFHGFNSYNGVHWYPRIAVYDEKFGWNTNQHIGKEFYGNFGTFNVKLNFPSNYIVEATGTLQNRKEVLPDTLREKLDFKHFVDKPAGGKPSVIIPYKEGERKIWNFYSENIHDFAFTASPHYRIDEHEWNGIKAIALVQEPNVPNWKPSAEFSANVIRVFSEDFGTYIYPKIVVADAWSGMEYPMITLCGGSDPGNRGLLAHEIAHMWFQSMLASNETYRAFMDEGFTQFATVWALNAIDGDTAMLPPRKTRYERKWNKPQLNRDLRAYNRYLSFAIEKEDPRLNTHSHEFGYALEHRGPYTNVYSKTATMLYNLQYVLGDELFLYAMKEYVREWTVAHPYPEDMRHSFIWSTGVDLNWFFDQWLESTRRIDYSIKKVRKGYEKDTYEITFKRKGDMQMPIDFRVHTYRDTFYDFHIPNTWFVKDTDAEVLPMWYGIDKIQEEYTAIIKLPEGEKIDWLEIDPSKRLADVYPMNNHWRGKLPPEFQFDSHVRNPHDVGNYEYFARPDIWYNSFDGLKLGFKLRGGYMDYKHVFDLNVWFNSALLQQEPYVRNFDGSPFNFRLNYRNGIENVIKGGEIFGTAMYLDGLQKIDLGVRKYINRKNTELYTFFRSMYRRELDWHLWANNRYNNTLNAGIKHQYRYFKGQGKIHANMRSSAIASDYAYAQVSLEALNTYDVKKIQLRSRIFAQYGTGDNVPLESMLYFSGANPEEMMDNKYTRAPGFFPHDWTSFGVGINHFHYGGGLNVRGYAGYLAPEVIDGDTYFAYAGNSGASANLELSFGKYVLRKSKTFDLDPYLFGDVGVMAIERGNDLSLTVPRASSGVGLAATIKRFGPLSDIKPLTIRADFPLLLSRPPYVDGDFVQFRWLIGISKAF
jgi:hypothetical protein